MKNNNTIKGRHTIVENGRLVESGKEYYWHIPKAIRDKNIEVGDLVLAKAKGGKARVFVTDVFREDVEDTGKYYKSIIEKIDKPSYLRGE